jgi:hypothetical protein
MLLSLLGDLRPEQDEEDLLLRLDRDLEQGREPDFDCGICHIENTIK